MPGNTLLANESLEQSINSCVREIDCAGHPIPFLLSPIIKRLPLDEIKARIDYNRTNDIATRIIEYEVAKPKSEQLRTLHRVWLDELVEYDLIARYFASIASRLTKKYSYSFVPDQLWNEDVRQERSRWMKFWAKLLMAVQCSNFVYQCDIEDYFNSILHDKLIDTVHYQFIAANPDLSSEIMAYEVRLSRLLSGWFPISDCRIPQGPTASFFFADVFLLNLDSFCEQSNYSMLRFVDDIFLLAGSAEQAIYQIDRIELVLEGLELRLNPSKSKLFASEQFIAEVHRVSRTKARFAKNYRTSHGSSKLRCILRYLADELQEENPNKSWVNYLLQALTGGIKQYRGVLSDNLLGEIMDGFGLYHGVFHNAVSAWRFLLNALVERPEVQEFIAQILCSSMCRLDTDKAFCYGSFGLTKRIHSDDLRRRLVSIFENDAAEGALAENGSEAACCGKALLAAMKHGKGAMILHEMVQDNSFAEMRLYTAVAASYLPNIQRKGFCQKYLARSQRLEECLAFDYFGEFDEQISPDQIVMPTTHRY